MLAERLKTLRNSRKFTQQYVADYLGMTRQAYAKYENKNSEPDTESLARLANLYNVSIDYLITGKEHTTSVSVAGQQINLTPDELKIFEELKKYPILFHDLASNPEAKVKELIKLQKAKKLFLEEDDEEYGDGFGELED